MANLNTYIGDFKFERLSIALFCYFVIDQVIGAFLLWSNLCTISADWNLDNFCLAQERLYCKLMVFVNMQVQLFTFSQMDP